MTKQEAKVYIQYIKVLLAMKGYEEETLTEALDMADYALDPEPVVPDPRFHWLQACHLFCHLTPESLDNSGFY